MPSAPLIFTSIFSLVVAVAALWHFADAAVHQASHVGSVHLHIPPLKGDVWAVMFHGLR